jgi:hypothetical protein
MPIRNNPRGSGQHVRAAMEAVITIRYSAFHLI